MTTVKVPGPKMRELIERHKRVLATTTHDPNYPLGTDRGQGIYIWDVDGNRFIDCFSQVSIADVGHCHPKVGEAVLRQILKLMACIGTDVYNTAQVEAAEKLTEITKKSFPKKDWRVYFCSSGGEANNAAVKLLLDIRPNRPKFISFAGAFHGRFGPALDLSGSKAVHKRGYPEAIPPIRLHYPDCSHCAYEKAPESCNELCIRVLEKEYLGRIIDPDEVNGVFIESMQGEGGIIVPNFKAMKRLYELCQKYDWAFVVDEVQTGLGRTGKMFAIEHFGITPDIICLAKKLGSGVPIGAIVFPRDWDFSRSGRHSTTFGGGPLGWAAAKATLEVLEEENLVENSAKMGEYFLAKLGELKKKFNQLEKSHQVGYIGEVRGLGLMLGVEFIRDLSTRKPNSELKEMVLKECLRYGIAPLGAGHSKRNPTIRFLPPLIATKTDIDEILKRFELALMAAYKKLSK